MEIVTYGNSAFICFICLLISTIIFITERNVGLLNKTLKQHTYLISVILNICSVIKKIRF